MKKTLKKVLCFAAIMAMVFSYTLGSYTPSYAANAKGEVKPLINTADKTYKEGEALVMFKTAKSMNSQTMADALDDSDLSVAQEWNFNTDADTAKNIGAMVSDGISEATINIALVKSSTMSTEEIIKKLQSYKNVIAAEPNYRIHKLDLDQEFASYQWALRDTASHGISVESEWSKTTGSDENVVAIVDTGIDYTHPDLAGNMWHNPYQPKLAGKYGYNFADGTKSTDPYDGDGHGTHCAGIIGGNGSIYGVNKNVKLMALKILDDDGYGWGNYEIDAYNYINKAMSLGTNVVAINNSWGGGEGSEIFAALIDIVGEKGAVTVCAAGNSASNNDEFYEYPTNIESDYLISVAASAPDGKLGSFSNYGESTVDIAAPGVDILSSVSESTYLPTLYGESQEDISQKYYSFNNTSEVPEDIETSEHVTLSIADSDKAFQSKGSGDGALKMEISGVKKGGYETISIPYSYTTDDEDSQACALSVMAKPIVTDSDESNILIIVDAAADDEVTPDAVLDEGEYYFSGGYAQGEHNYWSHFLLGNDLLEHDSNNMDRQLIVMYCSEDGKDATIYLDDIGISKDANECIDKFGQHDFYNGTSMATPYVTGAVAIKAAEKPDACAQDIINEILSGADTSEPLPVATKGRLDFTKMTESNIGIGLSSVKIGAKAKTIDINGRGFDNVSDLTIEVTDEDSKETKTANIIDTTANTITIEDEGWINNVISIKATALKGNGEETTAKKEEVYVVNGKKHYTINKAIGNLNAGLSIGATATKVIIGDSEEDTLKYFYPLNKSGDVNDIAEIDIEDIPKLFDFESNEVADQSAYDFVFGEDMAYANGYVYNVASCSIVGGDTGADDDDFWFFTNSKGIGTMGSEDGTPYISDYKILKIGTSSGSVKAIKLPAELERIVDFTLAAYNGKIYAIGGYDYSTESLSDKVFVYNPATGKWSKGPKLPGARAGAKAIQSGNKLVYALGYEKPAPEEMDDSEDAEIPAEYFEVPATYVFNGTNWTKSKCDLTSPDGSEIISRNGEEYVYFPGNIGLIKDGVAFMGLKVRDYGDTFAYSLSKDAYRATSYNYSNILYDEDTLTATVTAGTITGQNSYGEIVQAKSLFTGGNVVVSANTSKHGKVTGTGKYLPGSKLKLKVKAKKGYYIKSVLINGKKQSVKRKATTYTKTYSYVTANKTVKVVYKKK